METSSLTETLISKLNNKNIEFATCFILLQQKYK